MLPQKGKSADMMSTSSSDCISEGRRPCAGASGGNGGERELGESSRSEWSPRRRPAPTFEPRAPVALGGASLTTSTGGVVGASASHRGRSNSPVPSKVAAMLEHHQPPPDGEPLPPLLLPWPPTQSATSQRDASRLVVPARKHSCPRPPTTGTNSRCSPCHTGRNLGSVSRSAETRSQASSSSNHPATALSCLTNSLYLSPRTFDRRN
mmetsp:Transcript_89227/g.288425  ORF Transcript_89227/g.288425 Transcript_89227/m.288425 type:complete len:208 (-) Transcript_89227:164-787(-)